MSGTRAVCGTCKAHRQADENGRYFPNPAVDFYKVGTPHAHYCAASARGGKKIKSGADWNDYESPKFCPMRGENAHE